MQKPMSCCRLGPALSRRAHNPTVVGALLCSAYHFCTNPEGVYMCNYLPCSASLRRANILRARGTVCPRAGWGLRVRFASHFEGCLPCFSCESRTALRRHLCLVLPDQRLREGHLCHPLSLSQSASATRVSRPLQACQPVGSTLAAYCWRMFTCGFSVYALLCLDAICAMEMVCFASRGDQSRVPC